MELNTLDALNTVSERHERTACVILHKISDKDMPSAVLVRRIRVGLETSYLIEPFCVLENDEESTSKVYEAIASRLLGIL
jgi:hypothetical protein